MDGEKFIPQEALEGLINEGQIETEEENIEFVPEPKQRKSKIWNKVAKAGRTAAFIASFIAAGRGMAAESPEPKSEEEAREKISQEIEETQKIVETLSVDMERKGKAGKFTGLGKTLDARSFTKEDGGEIRVLYDGKDKDGKGKAKHVTYSSEDGSMMLVDYNADGSVDRIIFNDTSTDSRETLSRKKIKNDVNAFSSLQGLAEIANSRLKPEAIHVNEIAKEKDGSYSRSAVDFQSGKCTKSNGAEIDVLKAQGAFKASLESSRLEVAKK